MDQAASDYVLAVRVLHTGSIIMTHAVGHARAVAASYPALRSSCMSSPLSPSSVPPPGQIRGEGVCDVTLQTVKQGRPGCPGGRVLRVLRSYHFPIIPSTPPTTPSTQQQNRKRKNRKRKSKGSKREKGIGICKEVAVFIMYYASTQSRARTPEERSVVTCTTAPSSPERSRHRRTRSSPKFSLRWLAA